MKRIIVVIAIVLSGNRLAAQGLSNLFSQSSADIKYLLEQIALLELYIRDVEKGYQIAKDGLNFISKIKNGEFSLHSVFFSSLKTVNPAIARFSRVAEISDLQSEIISLFKKRYDQISNSKQMTASEWLYLQAVYNHLLEECSQDLEDLVTVTTDGVLEMSDRERIQRIDAIYADMKDKYSFAQNFTQEALVLSAERSEEIHDVRLLKTLE